MIDPLTIAAIGSLVGGLFKAKGAKNRAKSEEQLRRQTYEDDVQQWLAQQQAIEQDRQRKISLYAAFAKGNNLDKLMTPEMIATLSKPKEIVQPPPYRSGGVAPGSTWDMLGMGIDGASAAWATHKSGKAVKPGGSRASDIYKKAGLGSSGNTFGSNVRFGGSTTWGSPW